MYITANGEEVKIVEEQRDGDNYYVAKSVPIVKPMDLQTGYVPRESIASSTDIENTHGGIGWDGTTPTVNHPRNHREFSWHDPSRPEESLVLAANEDVQETLGVGAVENDRFDGEFIRADIAVNADKATGMGGEAADIVEALESEGPLEVSSQYLHAELPAGNYDGEHRENPKAIAAPDSVALIPNGQGVCSIEDGCGIAPGVTANVASYPEIAANVSTGTDDPGNSGEGQRIMQDGSNVAGVREFLSGLSSLLNWTAGPIDDGKSRVSKTSNTDPRDEQPATESTSDESAESDTDDTTANTTMQDIDREKLIAFITANSELKEDSLEHMGDTCLQNTHEMIVANAADGGSDGSDADGEDDDGTDDSDDDADTDADGGDDVDDTTGDTIADMTADELGATLKEQGFVTEDSIGEQVEATANALEAEERAQNIVANSQEYGEDDVEWIADLPEKELERKERGVNATGGVPAAGTPSFGATGNTDTDVDADDMPDLEVS